MKNNLHKFWYDIQKINEKDISFLTNLLVNKDFYIMYDYSLALNTVNYMDSKQADKIITKMTPLAFVDQRSPQTKRYANILLTNAISLKNYNQEYEKALQYIQIAEEQDPEFQSYYFRFDIQYHKNIALYFLNKDTKFIDEARSLIATIEAIQDIKTATVYTQELNNLISDPAYYKNNNDYDVVFMKEQN